MDTCAGNEPHTGATQSRKEFRAARCFRATREDLVTKASPWAKVAKPGHYTYNGRPKRRRSDLTPSCASTGGRRSQLTRADTCARMRLAGCPIPVAAAGLVARRGRESRWRQRKPYTASPALTSYQRRTEDHRLESGGVLTYSVKDSV